MTDSRINNLIIIIMSTSKTATATTETANDVKNETGLVVSRVAETMLDTIGFNPFDDFETGFESQDVTFFKAEDFLNVKLEVYLKDVISMHIKNEDKIFVRGYVKTDTDAKLFHFGQHQIIDTYNRNDKGKGVSAKITFEGKQQIGVRSLNVFKIEAKSC